MKHILIPILIFSMILGPVAQAQSMMDDAKKAVEFQKQNIEKYVSVRLSNDVNELLGNIFGVSKAMNDSAEDLTNLDIEMQRIQKVFSKVSSIEILNDENLDDLVNKLVTEYTIQNRRLFDLSWTPSTAAIFQKEFITIVTQMISGLKYQCTVGRNDVNFDPSIPVSVPPPKLAFSFMIQTSTADDRNGVQYNQYNYSMSKDVRDIQKYAAYGTTAGGMYLAGIYGNAMMNATAATMNSAVAGVTAQAGTMTALAATGVAVAVVVVIAIVSSIHGAKKRFKLMKEYHAAELHKFYNSLTSEDVSRMYRERCQDITASLDEALVRVKALAEGGAGAEKEKQRYYKEKEHFASIENDVNELNTLSKRIEKMEKEKASEEELKPLKEKEKVLEDNLEKIDSKASINMAAHQIVGSFGINSAKAFKDFKLDNVRKAFDERQKALAKLQKLIEIKRHADLSILENEKVAFKEYLILRSELLNILSETFEYIWGKRKKAAVSSRVNNFKLKIDAMAMKYLHVDEFRALKNSADWLVKFFEREP